LLPIAKAAPGSIAWIDPASATVSKIGGTGVISLSTCADSTATQIKCRVQYVVNPRIQITVRAANVGVGFREVPVRPSDVSASRELTGVSVTNTLDTDGAATVVYQGTLPLWLGSLTTGVDVTINLNAADHSITDPNDPVTGWFVRNEWHKLAYYAVSQGYAPGGASTCGAPPQPACLTINNDSAPTDNKRALLVLGGRVLPGQARPPAGVADYFEGQNVTPADLVFEKRVVNSSFNDRVVTVAQ
jgi:hypothetical protein